MPVPARYRQTWFRRTPAWLRWLAAGIGAFVAVLFLFLAFADWNALRGPIGRFASKTTGREIKIEGSLEVHALSLRPRISAHDLVIGNPDWTKEREMARVGTLNLVVKLLPILKGDVILDLVDIDHAHVSLVRDADQRANWDLSGGAKSDKPTKLPVVRSLVVNEGDIHIVDEKRNLDFSGTVWSQEHPGESAEPFRLEGKGQLNLAPFTLKITGSSLLNVKPDKPYSFRAHIAEGPTTIDARGTIENPFDLSALSADLAISGRDLASLYTLTGLALPNTPPYKVSGRLTREGTTFRIRDFTGTIGASDIAGEISINTTDGRPKVDADLRSDNLDYKDLGALLGGESQEVSAKSTAQEPPDLMASPAKKSSGSEKKAASERLLPDARLDVQRVRGMDAKVRYRAKAIKTKDIPLEGVSLDVSLDNGVLKIEPLKFAFPQGRLAGSIEIDARKDSPSTSLDLALTEVRLEQLMPPGGGQEPAIEGILQGRAKLTGKGGSVHDTAASADGTLAVVVPHGEIRKAFAELMGIDIARGLSLALSGSDKQTSLRCGVADFEVKNGLMSAQNVTIDTSVVEVTGSGTVNLATEDIDLKLQGHPKQISLRLRAPVTIGGQLANPKIGIGTKAALAQAGVAGALSIVLTPIGSVLAFIDAGLVKQADCAALLSKAQEHAAVPRPATE